MTPQIGARITNRPAAPPASADRDALNCPSCASAALTAAAACASAARASSSRRCGAAPAVTSPLGALTISRRHFQGGGSLGAAAFQLRQISRRAGRRLDACQLLPGCH
jgi:hypothetical protein